jgi:hypothetical protein
MFDYEQFKSIEELNNFIMKNPDCLTLDEISLIMNILFVNSIKATTKREENLMERIEEEKRQKYNKNNKQEGKNNFTNNDSFYEKIQMEHIF